jgi:hypothetical protein
MLINRRGGFKTRPYIFYLFNQFFKYSYQIAKVPQAPLAQKRFYANICLTILYISYAVSMTKIPQFGIDRRIELNFCKGDFQSL